jgi:hypothetical protein
MTAIKVYLGLNVQNLDFQCGGGPVGFKNGEVTYSVDATHRHLIEANLHPKSIALEVRKEVKYCYGRFDLHISTHSEVVVNVLAFLIREGVVNREDVSVIILNENNSAITHNSYFNEEGYLVNWPFGFFDNYN